MFGLCKEECLGEGLFYFCVVKFRDGELVLLDDWEMLGELEGKVCFGV